MSPITDGFNNSRGVPLTHEFVLFEDLFGDSVQLRVLHELVSVPEFEWTKVQLASGAEVARTTLDRVLERFLRWGFVEKTREIGHITLYRANMRNPIVVSFARFADEISSAIADSEAKREPLSVSN